MNFLARYRMLPASGLTGRRSFKDRKSAWIWATVSYPFAGHRGHALGDDGRQITAGTGSKDVAEFAGLVARTMARCIVQSILEAQAR